jgi:hypothetical protein
LIVDDDEVYGKISLEVFGSSAGCGFFRKSFIFNWFAAFDFPCTFDDNKPNIV